MLGMVRIAAYIGVVTLANASALAALWFWGDWYPTSLQASSATPAVAVHAVISLALLPMLRAGERIAGYFAATLANSMTLVGGVLVSSHTGVSDPLIIVACCVAIVLFNTLIVIRFVGVETPNPTVSDE